MRFSPRRFEQCADDLSQAVRNLRDEVHDREVRNRYGLRYHTLEPDMSITGLQSGAFQAMLAEMRKDIAEAQDQGVADVKAAKEAASKEIKTMIASVKDKIKSEVSSALQEFAQFSNGGEAIDDTPPAKPPATQLPPVNIVPDHPHIDATGAVEQIKLQNGETAEPIPS